MIIKDCPSLVIKKRLLGATSVFFFKKKILHRKCKEATFIQKALKSKQATFAHE